jgi:cyclic beta-1,2-glucan synthetase
MAPFSEDRVTSEHALPPTAPTLELPEVGLPERPSVSDTELKQRAEAISRQWELVVPSPHAGGLSTRLIQLKARLAEVLRLCSKTSTRHELTPQLELLESKRMLESVLIGTEDTVAAFAALPHVRVDGDKDLPRVVSLTESYLTATRGIWSHESFSLFVQQAQQRDALLLREVAVLPHALKLAQLEYIVDRAQEAFRAGDLPPIEQSPFSAILHSMRRQSQFEWRTVLEPLVAFDSILRQDPCGVFAQMEDETRHNYHMRVAELARHSNASEVETAQIALELAREATQTSDPDPRNASRTAHIGYYLFAEGLPLLARRIEYHPPVIERTRNFLRRWKEDFYILGIFTLSCLLIVIIIAPLVPHHAFWPVMAALLLALVPASQGGVDLMNYMVTTLMKADSLPKLDFSKGIPAAARSLVVVPTLLLNETQVQELFDQLEARYLSNQDPNIHFGLLTDLPDSRVRQLDESSNPLAKFAEQCINDLNTKYRSENGGSFFLLHRHRTFNSRQGVWMGWERKRGKLLDLNKLLLHQYDSFPLKAGPVEILDRVRYVITLDSDTQLPRGTAARMIGTMAHPLNQAIIDPRLRIVTKGYGILQPRVGVSVSSASSSRLASLYSGETGYDIYTRAVSDAYQDLFDEGIFTGKGIYEVGILHDVLDRRFPRDALLSHDLIEGSYVRAGLVTDIEIIDDYPSHYSAHTRRKHRWVRGDWQIVQWLFGSVPDESGNLVANPLSTISRWKILDNLRRSLVEPITFLLFLLGWFVLPGGIRYWTIAGLVLLFLPVFVQLAFNLSRALWEFSLVAVRDAVTTFAASFGFAIFNLIFLPHHMFLSFDAIIRSFSRRLVSGKHLLEWETAAQAELAGTKKPLDIYLQLSPVVALVIALLLAFTHFRWLFGAGPILLLWAIAPLVATWLNSSPRQKEGPLGQQDRFFLQQQALSIWRYFRDFGDEKNQWLIPDNVEEKNMLQVRTLSPTNLGMLLNARQAAYEFGFLTLPEFAEATLGTLATYDRIEKQRGHMYNWYDIETLQPLPPLIVSTVDSGNLTASFYTLHSGALDLLKRPLLEAERLASLGDDERPSAEEIDPEESLPEDSCEAIRNQVRSILQHGSASLPPPDTERATHRATFSKFLQHYVPWLLPEFQDLFALPQLNDVNNQCIPSLQQAGDYIDELQAKISDALLALSPDSPIAASAASLQVLLSKASPRLAQLKTDIATIAAEAERHAKAMNYAFLFVESRQLLSIGYDGDKGELLSACYDLLASEARIASFLAIAKGEIPQQSWFRLDRTHVLADGYAALLSWTGTMFEYMMPALWMRTVPNTLIARSLESVARIQREHVRDIPWGISESAYAKIDPQGRYQYQAWGIPALALKYGAEDGPVISPYSSFLAVSFLRKEAIANLRRMAALNWIGDYGFYESVDYTHKNRPELVRTWMAHHQGMSLLALANLLKNNIFQHWFHNTPRVRAAELLLHEKPLSKQTLKELAKQSKSRRSG